MRKQRIGVVGGGVAGIVASYLLQDDADVTLFEKNDYFGGHTNTIVIQDGRDEGLAVDTGFIVLNDRTYPLLHSLFRRLNVSVRYSDMSFGYYCERSGLQYAGTGLNGLFADRFRALNPGYLKFLMEISTFGKRGISDITRLDSSVTLGAYLKECGYGQMTIEQYILPMGAAIWSTPADGMLEFPALTFLEFFKNHGLLNLRDRPQWQTVSGGSFQYVRRFIESFKGTLFSKSAISRVARTASGVDIETEDGERHNFDSVVMAVHADQVLSLLKDPSEEEQNLFSVWSYQLNRAILHTDVRVLPPKKAARASWNYRREKGVGREDTLSLTYHMNRLQGLNASREYCVTLNSTANIREEYIIADIPYMHPLFTTAAINARSQINSLNGRDRIWFCGSYCGYGFHEDAVRSAVQVVESFGIKNPLDPAREVSSLQTFL